MPLNKKAETSYIFDKNKNAQFTKGRANITIGKINGENKRKQNK